MPIQYTGSLCCPVCAVALDIRIATGRRSGKTCLMVVCPQDGRHFRGFINDQIYVGQVISRLEAATGTGTGRGAPPSPNDKGIHTGQER